MLFPLTSSDPIRHDATDPSYAVYRSTAGMHVVAPLTGRIVMALLEEAPRVWMLYFEPSTPLMFPLFPGWLAPVPRGLTITNFTNADAERIVAAVADEHRGRTGRPALDLGLFDDADNLVGTRAIDLTDLEAGVHEILRRWTLGELVSIPVIEGQILYDGASLVSAQLSLMWHDGGGPTADVIYWFDLHEYFQRLSDQRRLETNSATWGIFPVRPSDEAERALETPFRIIATDAASSTMTGRRVELVGGMQNVSLTIPLRESTIIPREILYLLRNEDEPLIEARLDSGESVRWELEWGGTPAELLADSASETVIFWRHGHITDTDVTSVHRHLLITSSVGPARIRLSMQQDVIRLVRQVARRTIRVREAYYRWFDAEVAGHPEFLNRDAFLLHTLIADSLDSLDLSSAARAQIRTATDTALYRTYLSEFRRHADRVEGNILSWPRSLRYYLLENPAFAEQLIAQPTEARIAVLEEVFDALRNCEPGTELLKELAPGFFQRPGSRLVAFNVNVIALLWTGAVGTREILARASVDIIKADLLRRVNQVQRLIEEGRAKQYIRDLLLGEYEALFARMNVQAETRITATGESIEHFVYRSGRESLVSGRGLGRAQRILEIFDGTFCAVNIVISGVNTYQNPSIANMVAAGATLVDGAVTIAIAVRPVSRAIMATGAIAATVVSAYDFYASLKAAGAYASRDDYNAAGAMQVAALGALFIGAGELLTISVVTAPVGVALVGLGVVMMLFGTFAAAIEADADVTSYFNHCLFGRQYRLTARDDSAYHAWHGNLYRQISDLQSLFFPLQGTFGNDASGGARVTIAPKLFTGRARIFLRFYQDDRSLSRQDLYIELDERSRFAGSSEFPLSTWLLARVEGRMDERNLQLIFIIARDAPFAVADVTNVEVIVSFGEVPPECSPDDFGERYAFSTRQNIVRV
jgi:hypothetical protein